jgi:DNA-binding HxlR family transcriptional regulator
MRWADLGDSRCSIARALSVVGDRWTLLLLREVFLGSRRFEEFRENTGAARHIVSERLQHLVDHGVLDRTRYQDRPPRFAYTPTAKGLDLYPVILSLLAWGDEWMLDDETPSLTTIHERCGASVKPELRCSYCSKRLTAGETRHVVTGTDAGS